MKKALITVCAIAFVSSSQLAFAQQAPEKVSALELVDMFEKLGGNHPGFRKAHASGVCATGQFLPNPEISAYSASPLFDVDSVEAVVRFSMGSANPSADETAPGARGMAVQMTLPDGSKHTMAGNNTPFLTGKDPETFYGFLQTLLPNKDGTTDPNATGAYIAANPSVLNAVKWSQTNPVPSSYSREKYFGIHTFFFVDNDANELPFKWTFIPDLGEMDITISEKEGHPTQFLKDKLVSEVSEENVTFTLVAQLGTSDDVLNDPSIAWPDEREELTMGQLMLKTAGGEGCDGVNFDPNVVSAGFKPSDDPVLKMRSAAYAISFAKRLSNQ